MEISIRELQDYCQCPLLYKFRYIDKRKEKYSLLEQYKENMRSVICSFFYHLQDNKQLSLKELLHHWIVLWDNPQTKDDIIYAINSRSNAARDKQFWYSQGLHYIPKIYERYSYWPGVPIAVSSEYAVPIGLHILKGEFDLVREINYETNPQVEVISFQIRRQDTHIKYNIDLTAHSYAFRKLYLQREDLLTYHNLHNGRIENAYRNTEDYQSLLLLMNGITSAIKRNQYYPLISDRCSDCSYLNICQKKDWILELNSGGTKCQTKT